MPLSWNEIKSRSLAFSRKWSDASYEDGEAKPFLIDFFEIFGITDKRVASFEHAVKKHGGGQGFVDLFWPGILLVEMKSRGKDLDRAFTQAMDYLPGIAERDLPRYVLVCDFARVRLYDLQPPPAPLLDHRKEGESDNNDLKAPSFLSRRGLGVVEFPLADLYKNVRLFGFIAGYQTQIIKSQDPINIRAAERMGKLHDQLKGVGYTGRPLELYLVRLLFCLFAEDTSIFEKRLFQDYIEQRTAEDGSDLAHHIATLFHVLNSPTGKRLTNLDESLAAFPYVNGKLFEEMLPPASFDRQMREALLDLCALDWSLISPAIFGSLFQSIMDDKARRNLGAHYTSEENILKLIKPLFLDSLWAEFEKIKKNRNRLFEFHKRLRRLTFFDPACGCGNFLVITYRELRLLELAVLRAAHASSQQLLDIHQLVAVDVDQFYGIEIEEFPAQIAQVALWLTDHQMNLKVSEEFGAYFVRIPLTHSATIVHGSALQIEWERVLAPERCSYLLGNPPFVGAKFMSDQQREDVKAVFAGVDSGGLLDFVAAWYVKAVGYMKVKPHHHPDPPLEGEGNGFTANALQLLPLQGGGGEGDGVKAAFVSTNSICQGEQVGALWGWMLQQGAKIHFAHRTFSWTNEARGKAAVHCVIVGFGLHDTDDKTIFEYEDIKGEPHAVKAANINPYLVDGADLVLQRRSKPICDVKGISKGNQPTDGGHLILSEKERDEFLSEFSDAAHLVKRLMGAKEFLHGEKRYCLWLVNASPTELKRYPFVMKRIEKCRRFRAEEGVASDTIALAATPTVFRETRNPASYVVVPSVSSEKRNYIPFGFETSETIATNLCLVINDGTLYDFGLLSSVMHNAWVRAVCGRLKSDYRYSAGIVYNNFPWPEIPVGATLCDRPSAGARSKGTHTGVPLHKTQTAIETAAQAVLDARASYPGASLADLYNPLTMPPDLVKAHKKLDAAVDSAYGYKGAPTDAARVAFLFGLYQKLAELENR